MKTRAQAIRDLGAVVAEEIAVIETLTPLEAARRAFHPGGPSIDELTAYAERVMAPAAA